MYPGTIESFEILVLVQMVELGVMEMLITVLLFVHLLLNNICLLFGRSVTNCPLVMT